MITTITKTIVGLGITPNILSLKTVNVPFIETHAPLLTTRAMPEYAESNARVTIKE